MWRSALTIVGEVQAGDRIKLTLGVALVTRVRWEDSIQIQFGKKETGPIEMVHLTCLGSEIIRPAKTPVEVMRIGTCAAPVCEVCSMDLGTERHFRCPKHWRGHDAEGAVDQSAEVQL